MAEIKRVSKTIRLYEAQAIKDDVQVALPGARSFWSDLWHWTSGARPDERVVTTGNLRQYGGVAKTCAAPAQRYLAIGTVRDVSDWPQAWDETQADMAPLALASGGIAEPTYLIWMDSTPYVAILGGQRGASIAALELWINTVGNLVQQEYSVSLVPVIDPDTLAKLNRATEVTKVKAKVASGSLPTGAPDEQGTIVAAVDDLARATGYSMDLSVSLSSRGRRVTGITDGSLLNAVKSLLRRQGTRALEASLVREDIGGEIKREVVNLMNDRIATKRFMEVEAGAPVPESTVVASMMSALTEFRERGIRFGEG